MADYFDDEDLDDDEEFDACEMCGDEHPVGVLEDGFCPGCCDEIDEENGL